MTTDKHYSIVEWKAQNFMGIEAVTIRPNEVLTEITGKNSAGKTSAINALCWTLGGKEFAEAMPLRKGQKEGATFVDLGDLKVTKIMKLRDSDEIDIRLVVELADGSRPSKPQAVLDDLMGRMLDPLAFARAKGPQRIEMVKGLFPNFDFAENERKRKQAYDARTDINREHKREIAARDLINLPPGPRPKSVNVTELNAALLDANKANDQLALRRRRREEAADQAETKRDEAARLRAQALKLDDEAAGIEKQLAAAPPLPDPMDTSTMIAGIQNAEQINATVRLFEERDRHEAAASKAEAASKSLTAQIEALDKKVADAIAGAKLPFDGLAIGEDDVYLEGVPFEQIAFSKRMRASTTIAMALGSELRAMVIREYGSLLDSDSWKQLHDDAKAHGYQVIIETCDKAGPGKVVIANGRITS